MTRARWEDIEGGLRAGGVPGRPVPAAEFWPDFKARASLRRQELPAPRPLFLAPPAWALAAACLALLVAWAGIRAFSGPRGGELNAVRSFKVAAPHSAVMVLEDESTQSTVLWVVDMETAEDDGGNA